MKRSELRSFIKEGITALAQSIQFNQGRITEFNSERSNQYPYVWLVSPSNSPDFPIGAAPLDHWQVELHIAKLDKADSSPAEYEAIIDQCDDIARALTNQYRNQLASGSLFTIDGASREPFVHKHADNTTGVILTFTLNGPDTEELC